MKSIIIVILGALFSFQVSANNVGEGNSTAMGPRVDCQLSNGDVKYIPSKICMAQGGKVLYWN